MAKKTWAQKLNLAPEPHVSVLDKPFGGFLPGARLFIASPLKVKAYIEAIPPGETRSIVTMREEFARESRAAGTCPLTSSIFARIVAEAALDEMRAGRGISEITPFWRLIDPKSPIAKKLTCDTEFIEHRRALEVARPYP